MPHMNYVIVHVVAKVYGHRQLVLRLREWKFVVGSDLSFETKNIVF